MIIFVFFKDNFEHRITLFLPLLLISRHRLICSSESWCLKCFGSKVDFSWCSSILVTMVVIIINACGNLHCTNLVRRSLNSSIGVWMISLTENGISMLCAILWKFKRWFLRLQEKKSFFLRVRDQHHKHQKHYCHHHHHHQTWSLQRRPLRSSLSVSEMEYELGLHLS